MKILYFAWVRERIGKAGEEIALPDHVKTVSDVIEHLKTLGEEYGYAFENAAIIRAALDQTHAKATASIEGASEIAFFPPMTGG